MCKAMLENGEFDPHLCPLLSDLSPEEISERMSDPRIARCREAVEDPTLDDASRASICAEELRSAKRRRFAFL
ncbi:hypothetical protein HPQ64_10870 [Rhizobiales bacterium]|uniref:hypothetical protein n=1 Tax=Hongsoonwoonella zoysiae TaxID=2821844 RepID=UPI001561A97D|nr:hypothetical protein [Hongsoonwoonella zoysiae]NRG18193.1 hypothetical protein [Hongsoonwoonella zoysiae]